MKVVLKELTKRFANRTKGQPDVIAVNHFNIELPDGKLIGLLGPSGCGKSTALNLISGLEIPTEGQVFFEDDDVTKLPAEHRGVGLVFQNYALYPHLTVRQNIAFPLGNLKGDQKLPKEEVERRVEEAARLVQIDQLMDRKPSEMSGGQQQRVAIARALVKQPKILLLDEPLSNLDARLRLQTREELRRIQRETGITTVFVTHDQEEAMSISDLIIVMKEGVIQQVDEPQKVYTDPVNLFVAKFLGTPEINVFRGTVRGGQLFLGEESVLDVPGVEDREVYVGIRPEGFILSETGRFTMDLKRVEEMGRDTSVIAAHPAAEKPAVRAIISSENEVDRTKETVKFDIKPFRTYLFDIETEERIPFGG